MTIKPVVGVGNFTTANFYEGTINAAYGSDALFTAGVLFVPTVQTAAGTLLANSQAATGGWEIGINSAGLLFARLFDKTVTSVLHAASMIGGPATLAMIKRTAADAGDFYVNGSLIGSFAAATQSVVAAPLTVGMKRTGGGATPAAPGIGCSVSAVFFADTVAPDPLFAYYLTRWQRALVLPAVPGSIRGGLWDARRSLVGGVISAGTSAAPASWASSNPTEADAYPLTRNGTLAVSNFGA